MNNPVLKNTAHTIDFVQTKDGNNINKSLTKNILNKILLFTLAILFFTSCELADDSIDGEGGYTSKEYTISNFDAISVSSYADVYITKGETSLRIEAQANILSALKVSNHMGNLEIGKDNDFGHMKPLKVYVSTPQLNDIQTAGKIDVYSSDLFTAGRFVIDMSGSGYLSLRIEAEEISTDISGETDIEIMGSATLHEIDVSGLCDISCYNLVTSKTTIDVSGASVMQVNVDDYLSVDISGSTRVYYKGSPSIHQDISGSGKLIAVD